LAGTSSNTLVAPFRRAVESLAEEFDLGIAANEASDSSRCGGRLA